MGDLAAIFHWGPDVMNPMSLDELLKWHRLAIDRWNRMNPNQSKARHG